MFDLVDTIYPSTIIFKIKSTFTGDNIHISPTITTEVVCNNNYDITEVTAPTTPQLMEHGTTAGFVIGIYESSQNLGCPPSSFEVSASNTEITSVALNNAV